MSLDAITFDTVDGAQTAPVYVPNDASLHAPLVVIAPALGIRAGYYEHLCKALANAGMFACAVDSPGHGQSPARPSRGSDWGYAELCAHFASATRALKAARPGAPAILVGHSIGGQAALMLTGEDPGLADGVMVVASGAPYWRAWQGAESVRILASITLCEVLARTLGFFPGKRVGFGGTEARRLIVEWAQVSRSGSYDVAGFEGGALLRKPGPPVQAICLRGDDWAPRAAMTHVLDQMSGREVSFLEWLDAPHSGNHNRWPSAPDFVVAQLQTFIESL